MSVALEQALRATVVVFPWATCIAKDRNGRWYCYSQTPKKEACSWAHFGRVARLNCMNECNWQDSLFTLDDLQPEPLTIEVPMRDGEPDPTTHSGMLYILEHEELRKRVLYQGGPSKVNAGYSPIRELLGGYSLAPKTVTRDRTLIELTGLMSHSGTQCRFDINGEKMTGGLEAIGINHAVKIRDMWFKQHDVEFRIKDCENYSKWQPLQITEEV